MEDFNIHYLQTKHKLQEQLLRKAQQELQLVDYMIKIFMFGRFQED